jgi:hypothetical protein
MPNELEDALKAFEEAFNMGGVQQPPATPAMTTQAPITAQPLPPKPPEPVDTFTPMLKAAVQDERFAALPSDEKWKFINLAMDDDERLRGLDERARYNTMQNTIEEFQQEYEFEQSGAGQFQELAKTPLGRVISPFMGKHLEDESGQRVANIVAGTPILSTGLLEFPRGVGQLVADMFGGAEAGAQAFKKQLEQGDYNPDQVRFFGNAADWMQESIDKIPRSTREGVLEDVTGAVAGTAGYLAPMAFISMATGGSSILPQMYLGFGGSQRRDVLDEMGVMESPEWVMASAALQTASERLIGPGSMVGRNIFRPAQARRSLRASKTTSRSRHRSGAPGTAGGGTTWRRTRRRKSLTASFTVVWLACSSPPPARSPRQAARLAWAGSTTSSRPLRG